MNRLFYQLMAMTLTLAFTLPSIAMAYDPEGYRESMAITRMASQAEKRFEAMNENQKKTLRQEMIQVLDSSEGILSFVEEGEQLSISGNDFSQSLDAIEIAESLERNKGFKSFRNVFSKIGNKKLTKKINKEKYDKKINDLKLKLKSLEKVTLKTFVTFLKIVAGLIYCYAVVFFMGAIAAEFLMTVFGGLLGVFGVYFGLILALGVGLFLVVGPIIYLIERERL